MVERVLNPQGGAVDLAESKRLQAAMSDTATDAHDYTSERIKNSHGWLIAEVERLTGGIQDALNTPHARAYILEHTLKNGADNCCQGRCQGHGTAEAVRP